MLDLYRARHKKIYNQPFNSEITDFTGDVDILHWHRVTVDTNTDQSSGLMGGIALDCAGCYESGYMEKTIALEAIGEMTFDYYIQNSNETTVTNRLAVYVDGEKKWEMFGHMPWRRCEPIGLPSGTHTIRFEYYTTDTSGQKVILDNIEVWEGYKLDVLVTLDYTPPVPIIKDAESKTLRGFTYQQQMCEYDTDISFIIEADASNYLDLRNNIANPHYFVDEFGMCYRGKITNFPKPKSPALTVLYIVEFTMKCPQKVGDSFV